MGAKLRVVRRRIRSVQSTMKITRAMELIAASRIVKAQQRLQATLPYTRVLTAAISEAASNVSQLEKHPLLAAQRVRERAFAEAIHQGIARPVNASDFQAILADMRPSIPQEDLRKFDEFTRN